MYGWRCWGTGRCPFSCSGSRPSIQSRSVRARAGRSSPAARREAWAADFGQARRSFKRNSSSTASEAARQPVGEGLRTARSPPAVNPRCAPSRGGGASVRRSRQPGRSFRRSIHSDCQCVETRSSQKTCDLGFPKRSPAGSPESAVLQDHLGVRRLNGIFGSSMISKIAIGGRGRSRLGTVGGCSASLELVRVPCSPRVGGVGRAARFLASTDGFREVCARWRATGRGGRCGAGKED